MAVVMIVDDDMDVREWIAHCVEQEGHTVVSAVDAPAALDLWAAGQTADVVLLDYALPGLDGVTLLGRLRELTPALPAVFVTAQWAGRVIERIAATGVERVAKPFEPDHLRAAVRRALEPTREPSA